MNATKPQVHISVYSGSRSASVVDMTDAHKRGKRCRTLRFQGMSWNVPIGAAQVDKDAESFTVGICYFLDHEAREMSFDDIRTHVLDQIASARSVGIGDRVITLYEESMRAIDAPREVLSAGVAGLWSGSADSNGIHLRALDDINEWTEITAHRQTHAAAYTIAAKVWPQVQAAKTLREASQILSDAGARLHGYCGLD